MKTISHGPRGLLYARNSSKRDVFKSSLGGARFSVLWKEEVQTPFLFQNNIPCFSIYSILIIIQHFIDLSNLFNRSLHARRFRHLNLFFFRCLLRPKSQSRIKAIASWNCKWQRVRTNVRNYSRLRQTSRLSLHLKSSKWHLQSWIKTSKTLTTSPRHLSGKFSPLIPRRARTRFHLKRLKPHYPLKRIFHR